MVLEQFRHSNCLYIIVFLLGFKIIISYFVFRYPSYKKKKIAIVYKKLREIIQ